jgi:hypothetical protein
VFAFPLGPGQAANSFQHAGGEAIFTLPNGLHAYVIVNAANERINKAADGHRQRPEAAG